MKSSSSKPSTGTPTRGLTSDRPGISWSMSFHRCGCRCRRCSSGPCRVGAMRGAHADLRIALLLYLGTAGLAVLQYEQRQARRLYPACVAGRVPGHGAGAGAQVVARWYSPRAARAWRCSSVCCACCLVAYLLAFPQQRSDMAAALWHRPAGPLLCMGFLISSSGARWHDCDMPLWPGWQRSRPC